MINDVSTDLENPPVLHVAGREIPFPENSKQALARKRLAPWVVHAKVEDAQGTLLAIIEGRDEWTVEENVPGRIRFVATSRIFRFKDDVVVRLQPVAEGTRVDVRSRSRMGKGDFGANASRIRGLLNAAKAMSPP